MPKVIIIGGGIGGLVLAQALKSKGIELEVYDKPTTDNYYITLDKDGYKGLKESLPESIFKLLETPLDLEKTMFNNLDEKLGVFWNIDLTNPKVDKSYSYERKYLIESLSKDLKIINKTVKSFTDGEVEFEDGSKEQCDLVIAADGSKSTVRDCLYPNKLIELENTTISGKIDLKNVVDDEFGKEVKTGPVIIYADGCSAAFDILKLSDKEDHCAFTFTVDYKVKDSSQDGMFAVLKDKTSGWREEIKKLILNCDKSSLKYKIPKHVDPKIKDVLKNDKKAVFLGDSIHATFPVKGCGAKLAILDAQDLVEPLTKFMESGNLDQFKEYNSKITSRGVDAIKDSNSTNDLVLASGMFASTKKTVAFTALKTAAKLM